MEGFEFGYGVLRYGYQIRVDGDYYGERVVIGSKEIGGIDI
jgi:hypothetical protein